MKNKTIKISIRIIAVFMVAIVMSFVPDLLPKFFGDWLCNGSIHYSGSFTASDCMNEYAPHDSTWHWGYRHYVWFFMGLILFVVQAIDIVSIASNKD